MTIENRLSAALALLLLTTGCPNQEDHGHPHGEAEALEGGEAEAHGHEHGEEGPGEAEHGDGEEPGHDDHGGAPAEEDHGHGGHEGASEVVTIWSERTQLFVEFPALVVGEESAFAAHLTRLRDHFAVDSGTVTVVLSSGDAPVERFQVDGPSVAGIFRPIVIPTHPGVRHITLRLDSPAVSDEHDMGEFTVFATRAEADAAAGHEDEPEGGISYLLEQQWRVPFRLERVEARAMRPNFPAFGRMVTPNDAEALVRAPQDGRLAGADDRVPAVGHEVAAGQSLFGIELAPAEAGGDPATLELAVEQATIRVEAAQREVDRVTPLLEQGVVPQRRVEEAQSELDEAEAELRTARRRRSNFGRAQEVGGRAGDSVAVPSPIDGMVTELFAAPGTFVQSGDDLARIVDRNRLWLDVGVPEAYVGRLGEISGAWFTLQGFDGVFELGPQDLVSVGTEVDPEARTLPVRFNVDNLRHELFAGQTTQVYLIADAPVVAPAVPARAVIDDGGVDVVYIQLSGETFVRRPVRLGIRDGEYVETLEGVAPGEWVVAQGGYSVKLASTSTQAVGHGHAH